MRAADGDERHGPFLPKRGYEDEAQCDINPSLSPLLKHYQLVQPETKPAPEALPPAAKEKASAGEHIHDYSPSATYPVTVATSVPLDILLEPGEQVRNVIGGDREPATEETQTRRWVVKEGGDGAGEGLRHHIFVSVTEPGLTMGMIITTTKRVYYLSCKSVKTSPVRAVRWRYPVSETPKAQVAKGQGILPDPDDHRQYHVGYEFVSTHTPPPHWLPRQVVDDGKKTYILYPEVTLFDTVPVLRTLGPNGPQLVNARQYLNVVILDQLLGRAELRVGIGDKAETVTIARGNLRTIQCPGDEACPHWPQAATILARRQP
jgi:type IV secretory pathway VirB9-like protein